MKFQNLKKTYIVAEIGINHEGNLNTAMKLVSEAKKNGADAVKFQVFNPKTIAMKKSKIATFHKKNIGNTSYDKIWNKLKINYENLYKLKKLSLKLNIDFICTAFDFESLDIVKKIGVNALKIASSDITDIPLIKEIAKVNKPIILSTGMSKKSEILKAVKTINKKNLALLHCVSMYPCDYRYANLKRITSLKDNFKGFQIGYSDHCKDVAASITAITLGAKIIEKHFTLDKKKNGLDHNLSADPKDLKIICDFAKNYKISLGKKQIEPNPIEFKFRKLFRKGIYAKKIIKKNKIINQDDLIIRRPENTIKPEKYFYLIGKKNYQNIEKNSEIKMNYVKKKNY